MSHGGLGGWWGVAAAGVVLALAFGGRRRFPTAATLLALAAALWCPPAVLGVLALAYLAGHRESRWWQPVGGLVVGVIGVPVALWAADPPAGLHPDLSLQLLIVIVLPWLVGRYVRQRALLRTRAEERARAWAREHASVLARARSGERDLIAADMHDALGHDLSLLSLHVGALARDPALEPGQRERAELARRLTGEAAEHLHDVVELLASQPPEPLDSLVDRANVAGARVHLEVSGDHRPSSPVAVRLIHDIVREAITNAARHAPGEQVKARVAYAGDGTTRIEVENSLATPPGPHVANPAPATGGTGLARLEDRLRHVGGRIDRRHADGRFVVTADVPSAAAGREPSPTDSTTDDPVPGGDAEQLRAAAEATSPDLPIRAAFWRTVAAPTLAFATVIAGYSLYVMNEPVQRSAMTATAYAGVRIGQPWPTADLAASQAPLSSPPAESGSTAPSGSRCHYYARRTFGPFVDGYFRVCTASGRVVSRERIDA